MNITINQIEKICQYYMKELWNDKFEIPVEISPRLIRSLAYFRGVTSATGKRTSIKIVVSQSALTNHSTSTIINVIKHELTHYYLFKTGQNYRDGDKRFEDELIKIGSTSTGTITKVGELYEVKCKCCNKVVMTTQERLTRKFVKKDSRYFTRCCESKMYLGDKIYAKDKNARIEIPKSVLKILNLHIEEAV